MFVKRPSARTLKTPAKLGAVVLAAALAAGCVNQSGTAALTPDLQPTKAQTHEEEHVARRCNSSERLRSSLIASSALNAKFNEYNDSLAGLEQQRRDAISSELKSWAETLQSLDATLKRECDGFSRCEYQASLNKQDCNAVQHRFTEADKAMLAFADRVNGMQIK